MPNLFVFDGDDTLWYSEYTYSQAYADFFAFLYEKLGYRVPNIHFIYKVFSHIEDRNVPLWGVKRGRVAESMVETYELVCKYARKKWGQDVYDPKIEEEIRKIGDQPFDLTKHVWAPDAESTLTELLRRGHALRLLTKYDSQLWPEKAAILRAERFFANGHVVTIHGKKELPHFEQFFSNSDFSHAYAVGNSASDLVPAMCDGDHRWSGFYVPLPTSVPELEIGSKPTASNFNPMSIDHPCVVTLGCLSEIFRYI